MAPFTEIESRRRKARSSYTDIKKHYVRLNGWLPVFRRYSNLRGGAPRYLTLCAKHAIDIRYFRQKGLLPFDDKQKIYPTVTFIEKDAQDYAIIAESLGKTRLGIKGDLEEILVNPIANVENSERLRESFPYDIVNLDFTGQVARPDDPPYSDTIRAIERVIELQNAANSPTWHMFLTFRACLVTSNHEADNELSDIIEGNLQNAEAHAAYGARPEPRELIRQRYQEFIRIGVTKFLAHSALQRGYACTLERSYIYPRNPEGDPPYHIVKLIVEFSPTRGAGHLPNPQQERVAYDQCVPLIFRSQAIDVNVQLGNAKIRRRVVTDLRPVLVELEAQNIVA
jgi:hypothetical protein